MSDVPYIKLNQVQLNKCLTTLLISNVLLKKWAGFFGAKKRREFRKQLFKGHRDPAVMKAVEEKIPSEELDTFRKDRKVIISVHMDPHGDLGNRTIEFAMLCGYSALARKHAKRWFAHNGEGSGMSLADFQSEAYSALLDAIYGYTKEEIEFTTFVWTVLKNRMIHANNQTSLLGPLTNTDMKLLANFEKAKSSFNRPVTFDEIAEVMGLSEEEKTALGAITTKVFAESQIRESPTGVDENSSNDYTADRLGVAKSKSNALVKMNVKEAIDRADLTSFEKIVLETSMEPYYGWQSDVARKNINPKTNKPYTRMWVSYAIQNAHRKLKRAMAA